MSKKRESKISRAGGPPPKPELSLEFDCCVEDIFTSPRPAGSAEMDSAYIHESHGLFARIFGRKNNPDPKKAA